jgi:membrane protein implicated in regulation of membrane protease activity
MDRKTQRILLIALGFLILVIPLIFRPFFFSNYLWTSGCVGVGLNIMLIGWFRGRDRTNKGRREEIERKKGQPRTNGEIVGIIGSIVFFTSLGIGIISAYAVKMTSLTALFLLLFAVGILIVFMSNLMVREERRIERQKQSHI